MGIQKISTPITENGTSQWLQFVEKVEEEFKLVPLSNTKRAGIGGFRHQQIQLLVRNSALELGYGAEIEQQIQGGLQLVDVGIRGHNIRVACEIPISSKYKEYGNIRKCLDAGFDYVVSVALEREILNIVKKRAWDKLTEEEKKRVRFFFPEELTEFLTELKLLPETGGEVKVVRGYKVRVVYLPVSPQESQRRRSAIAEVIARSVLRDQEQRGKV